MADALYLIVLLLLAAYGGHRLWLIGQAMAHTRGRTGESGELPATLPVVTVQLPLFNEACVAERVIAAAAAIDWPRDRLEIQVLDDSTDETAGICARAIARLQQQGFDAHHLHRDQRTGFKAGALAAGLSVARGDLLLILDADFVPRADILRRTVGAFGDESVGMVQVRWEHLNRNRSLLTRIQALLLDGHFAVEQAVRSGEGRFFNFNGTAGVWRRAAIESAGGWQHDTLTEDLDLSYRALLAGWQFRYVLGETAPAELPEDMTAFKSQQYRWAKGSAQCARKLLPSVFRAPVSLRVKVDAFFHLTQNVPYVIALMLAVLVVPVLAFGGRSSIETALIDLPLLVATTGTLLLYVVTSQTAIRRGVWSALCDVPALIAITAGICVSQSRAVIEGLAGHRSPFVRTPKRGDAARQKPRYRVAAGLVPIAELAMAAYLASAAALAAHDGRALALPVLVLFTVGFAYVGVLSITRR